MRRVSTILAIGFGCVAVVAAQTSSPQTSSPSQTSAKSNTITVTGCLQHGDQSGAVGTSGTAAAGGAAASRTQSEAGNSAQFILTNAKNDSSSESTRSAGATTGAATSAGASATAGTSGTAGAKYVLEPGSAQSELTTNVGKRVEVTGTLDNSMSSSTPAASATATSAAGSATASASAPQKIRVASVRVIGSDCSSQQ